MADVGTADGVHPSDGGHIESVPVESELACEAAREKILADMPNRMFRAYCIKTGEV